MYIHDIKHLTYLIPSITYMLIQEVTRKDLLEYDMRPLNTLLQPETGQA